MSLLAHDAPVNQVVASSEGGYYATADTNLAVKVWRGDELATAIDVRSILDKVRPTERVRGLAFTPDVSQLVIAAGELVSAYSLADPAVQLWSFAAPRLFAFLVVSPTGLAISRSGIIASSFDNGSLAFFSQDGNSIAMVHHNAVPNHVQALSNGRFMGVDAFSVTTWEPGKKKPLKQMGVKDRIYGFSSTPNGEVVAVRHLFETDILAFESGQTLASFKVGRGLPLVRMSPDATCVALGSKHEIAIYGLGSSSRHTTFPIVEAELISLNFDASGRQIIAGCSDGRVRIWQIFSPG